MKAPKPKAKKQVGAKMVDVQFVEESRFGFMCITTGPLTLDLDPLPQVLLRVIAFNWRAHPKVNFHSLN